MFAWYFVIPPLLDLEGGSKKAHLIDEAWRAAQCVVGSGGNADGEVCVV